MGLRDRGSWRKFVGVGRWRKCVGVGRKGSLSEIGDVELLGKMWDGGTFGENMGWMKFDRASSLKHADYYRFTYAVELDYLHKARK